MQHPVLIPTGAEVSEGGQAVQLNLLMAVQLNLLMLVGLREPRGDAEQDITYLVLHVQ